MPSSKVTLRGRFCQWDSRRGYGGRAAGDELEALDQAVLVPDLAALVTRGLLRSEIRVSRRCYWLGSGIGRVLTPQRRRRMRRPCRLPAAVPLAFPNKRRL